MTTAEEIYAIEAVLAGEADAFAPLVRAHKGMVLAVCVSFLGNTPAADDAAQEVFLKAYGKLGAFRKEASFSTWLCAIARRRCLDLLRERGAAKTQSLDALVELKGDSFAAPAAPGPDYKDIGVLLESLPPDYRLVLALREAERLSYAEIALRLDCTVDSVKARLKRARRELLELARHFLPDMPSNKRQEKTEARP